MTEPLLAGVINLSTTGTTVATSHQSPPPPVTSLTCSGPLLVILVVICMYQSVTIIDTGGDQQLQELQLRIVFSISTSTLLQLFLSINNYEP